MLRGEEELVCCWHRMLTVSCVDSTLLGDLGDRWCPRSGQQKHEPMPGWLLTDHLSGGLQSRSTEQWLVL